MNAPDFEQAFQDALKLRDAGDLQNACIALSKLGRLGMNSAALFAVLGDTYSELGRIDAAIESFREAVRLAPKSELASLGLFHALWRAKIEQEAFDEIRRFMGISDSQDYRQILQELWEKRVKQVSRLSES